MAQTGQPLKGFYDKKQSQQLHEFVYKGVKRVVWRLRKGDVRLILYYAEGKVIFLADAEQANELCVIQPEVRHAK